METYSTMETINLLLSCCALNCVRKKDNVIISSWSFKKCLLLLLVLCFINAFTMYVEVIETDLVERGFTFENALHYLFILHFLKYLVDLVYVRNYSTKQTVNYYYAFTSIDCILKINDYKKIKATCFKTVVFIFAFYVISFLLDTISWHFAFPYAGFRELTYIMNYIYALTHVLCILDMVSHVVQIEYRLRAFGDIAEKFNRNKNMSKLSTKNWSNHSEATNLNKLKTLNVRESGTHSSSYYNIISLSQCYLTLTKQTQFINTLFGFRMLLTSLLYTITLTININVITRVPHLPLICSFIWPFLSGILCLMADPIVLYTLAHRCEKVYRQSDRIVDILEDLIVNIKAKDDIIVPLKELRELISSRPMHFHALHFFRIDYTLLTSITSVAVTYTIICLQSFANL